MFRQVSAAVAACVFLLSANASTADDHPYSEGPVINVASIRTAEGKFDEYMAWLSTTWRKLQEEAKKRGYIVNYQVMLAEPRGPNDPDILLITTYKNWAALDGQIAKGDELAKAVEGSVDAANRSQADRDKIRRVLGSETVQQLVFK